MKSFRITKSKEQIEEQRKVEEHSLKELSEFFNLLITAKQEERPITEEQIVEHSEIIETITVPVEEEPLIVEPKSLVDVTAEQIKQSVKEAAFELPDAPKPAPEIKILQQKVQDITNWLSKITMTGPGSGEVNLRWLDDVDRNTIVDGRYLRYDQASKKFVFDDPHAAGIGIQDYIQFNDAGPGIITSPGTISWNPIEDCLDVKQGDGSTLQAGLEQYFRVYNDSNVTLTQGTLVGFGGVHYDDDELPIAVPFLAHQTSMPLYIMGVLTNDIPPYGVGRSTILGKVRTLDTTGDSGLGETWAAGDLLWAHPTMAGRLTKVQPTAPYPAISIAAVLRAHATDGVILVRPSIFPRLWFGRFRDFTNQSAAVINTPYAVRFGQTAIASGMHIDSTYTSRVVADHTGLFKFDIRLQFTSSNSSISKIWVWYRVDGTDVVGTGTQYTIASNGGIAVATLPYIVSLQEGHYFELMWAVDSTTVSLMSPAATSFCPSTPCAVIAATQVNL